MIFRHRSINSGRPDRRAKIGEKLMALARVSGYEWLKPDSRAKIGEKLMALARVSGLRLV